MKTILSVLVIMAVVAAALAAPAAASPSDGLAGDTPPASHASFRRALLCKCVQQMEYGVLLMVVRVAAAGSAFCHNMCCILAKRQGSTYRPYVVRLDRQSQASAFAFTLVRAEHALKRSALDMRHTPPSPARHHAVRFPSLPTCCAVQVPISIDGLGVWC